MTYLSNTFVPLERNGDTITLAGIDDPNGYAGQKGAGTALLAEHSMVRDVAAGRPDNQDRKEMADFGARILEKLEETSRLFSAVI